MFPMVPYHALPRLHAAIRHDLPAPNPSIAAAFAEMWPALKRQLQYEEYFLKRDLPDTAKPYREDFHRAALGETARRPARRIRTRQCPSGYAPAPPMTSTKRT
jgi:hypothetical protein